MVFFCHLLDVSPATIYSRSLSTFRLAAYQPTNCHPSNQTTAVRFLLGLQSNSFCVGYFIFLFRNRARKILSLYAAVNYGFFAIFQNISITEQHSFAICSSNLLLFLLISAFWLWEMIVQKNDFTPRKPTLQQFWVLIPAAISFWEPIHPVTLMPDFSLTYLLTSGAGLSFCMMTPVYIAIITIFYPTVNLPLLRVTSIIGAIIGLGNVAIALIQLSNYWWVGIMHIPLIITSIYGLILSYTSFLPENC